MDLYKASGKIERHGPRSAEWHLGQDKIIAYLKQQGKL